MTYQESRIRRLEQQAALMEQRQSQQDKTLDAIWSRFEIVDRKADEHYESLMNAITANKITGAEVRATGKAVAGLLGIIVAILGLGLAAAKFFSSIISGGS